MRAGRRARRHRGRGLPLLPPERPLPRQRLRLPHEGGGGSAGGPATRSSGVATDMIAARPASTWTATPTRARQRAAADGRPRAPTCSKPTRRQGRASAASARELWPDPGFVDVGVRGDLGEFDRAAQLPACRRTARGAERKFIDAVAGVMDRRMATDAAHRRAGRGRAPPERRHERRDQAASRDAYREPRARHRRSARTRSPASAGGHRARRPRSGPSSSSCTPTSCGSPPTRCSTRSARPGTCSAVTARVPLVLRTKVAMGSGYGSQHLMDPAGHLRHQPRAGASSRPRPPPDYVGLMNAGARPAGPGARDRARRPVRPTDRVPRWRPRLRASRSGAAAIRRAGSRGHGHLLPRRWSAQSLAADRADRRRRRADRPALAGPRLASTGTPSAPASRRPTPC